MRKNIISEDSNHFGIALVLVFVVCFYVIAMSYLRYVAAGQFFIELEEDGYIVENGIIKSPSVVVIVDTPEKFMKIIKEHYEDAIYYYSSWFYIFNDDMTIAWKYSPEAWSHE